LDMDFTIEQGTQSIEGLLLSNGGTALVVITNANAPPVCSCTPGSSTRFTLPVVELLRMYIYIQ